MKKLILTAAVALFAFTANAQEESTTTSFTAKGRILVEANTGNETVGNTGLYFSSLGDVSRFNIGFDGGYFIQDDLALKVGLGYGMQDNDGDETSSFSYRVGAKYYVKSKIPVTLDLTGSSVEDADEDPLWLGIGAGYAFFLGNNVSIEPGLRYNTSLNEDYTDEGGLQLNVGFVLSF